MFAEFKLFIYLLLIVECFVIFMKLSCLSVHLVPYAYLMNTITIYGFLSTLMINRKKYWPQEYFLYFCFLVMYNNF